MMWPPSSGSSGIRLKTNSAMFRLPRMPMRLAAFETSGTSGELAISPATRPTPTTLIGPFGSRGPLPNAACATPTRRCGRCTITLPTATELFHTAGSTADAGCLASCSVGLIPMKPTVCVSIEPAPFFTGAPFASVTATVFSAGVTAIVRRPSGPVTVRVMRLPADLRMTPVTSVQPLHRRRR